MTAMLLACTVHWLAAARHVPAAAARPHVGTTQSDIYGRIMAGYSDKFAPIAKGTPVDVLLWPNLEAIVQLDERKEQIEILQWWRMRWKDERLLWNASEYGGTSVLFVPADDLWLPDVTMFELMELKLAMPDMPVIGISADGWVNLLVNAITKAKCLLEMDDYPFDYHTCVFRYASWAYPADKLTLANTSTFTKSCGADKNQEWKITDMGVNVTVEQFAPGKWYVATYYLSIERRPWHYIRTHLIPISLVTALVIMGLFTPYQSQLIRFQKVGIGLTGLLAHSILLLRVVETLPKMDSGTPYFGRCIIWQIAMCAFATVIATALVEVNSLATLGYNVPHWLMFICGLGRYGNTVTIVATPIVNDHNAEGTLTHMGRMGELCAATSAGGTSTMSAGAGASHTVDEWSVICFRIDALLLVAFETANIAISLSFAAGPH